MIRRIKLYFHFLKSMVRVNKGLLTGMWKLTKLKQPAITVFGGTKLSKKHPTSAIICELAKKLSHAGFSIITGGGPGVMEAANLGAKEHALKHNHKDSRAVTMGIGLSSLNQAFNKYVQLKIIQPYFFTRKWLLVRYSSGFIAGPGGFGTLDELSEILTLIQTHSMPKTPVVLIGKKYWKPLIDWVYKSAVEEKLLTLKDAGILNITDSVEEAFKIITSKCKGYPICGIEASPTEKKIKA